MSLRIKYLIAAALSVILPLLGYLLFDAAVTRSFLIQDHVASLRLASELIQSSLEVCEADCPRRAQILLSRFARSRSDLEVMLLDRRSRIVASTDPVLRGRTWREEGIRQVLAREEAFSWAIMDHHGELVLDVTMPWESQDGYPQGAIHLARKLTLVQSRVSATRRRHAAFVAVVAIVVGLFLSLVTYRLVIRRLGRLDHDLRSLEGGSRAPPEGGRARDEIDRLSSALHTLVGDLASTAARLERALEEKSGLLDQIGRFNEELEREVRRTRQDLLAAQRELVQAEHVATIGQLSAGLAHELRNPLFIIRASAEAIRRKHAGAAAGAGDIIEEVDRVNGIITRLMELARPMVFVREPVELRAVLEEAVAITRKVAPARIALHLDPAGPASPLLVSGDLALLRQAFLNLLANAREAIAGEGEIRVALAETAEGWEVVVADSGRGIAPEDLPRVFEPFFSKSPGGTGLGLCATKKILDLHDAAIQVESEPGQGTRVSVRLRRAEEEARG